MPAVDYTRSAISDLSQIYDYTVENWGVDQAEQYVMIIRQTGEALADAMVIHRSAWEEEGFYKARAGKHLLFYEIKDGRVIITRILHQSMDATRHLPSKR